MSASYVPVRGDSPPPASCRAKCTLTSMLELESGVWRPVCTAIAADQGDMQSVTQAGVRRR